MATNSNTNDTPAGVPLPASVDASGNVVQNKPVNVNVTSTADGGKIRNIIQTHQEREIIKTSPDVIVYLENQPYLINRFARSGDKPYTVVAFNDHVISFQAGYDVEELVPSCTISLTVPNFQKHLYLTPGGNSLIESMMYVSVFAKGYYPDIKGRTVYHRVFRGVVSSVNQVDDGTTLAIGIQCRGALHFFEFMYVDLNPSILSNSPNEATPFITRYYNLNPYDQLAATFAEAVTFEGFQLNSILQSAVKDDEFKDAIEAGYVNKWNSILLDIVRDTRVFGNQLTPTEKYKTEDTAGGTGNHALRNLLSVNKDDGTKPTEAQGGVAPDTLPETHNRTKSQTSITFRDDNGYQFISQYVPDYGIGSITMLNGHIVSRLERIRLLTQLIGLEGYQDIDGMIIFKPPLYNLDVTNLGTGVSENAQGNMVSTLENTPIDHITDETNPFIVHLSEIESEAWSEDQAAVRVTRVSIQPSWLPSLNAGNTGTETLRPVVSHTDIAKLSKFGLREQPANTVGWVGIKDKKVLYAFAVAELVRQNRAFRTYNITIPLRPELRLGFPMYVPHRDIYGYIKNISINFTTGGVATMTITLDCIRTRPMFLNKEGVLTTQPNLVMEWTTLGDTSGSAKNGATTKGKSQSLSGTPTPPPATLPTFSKLSDSQARVKDYLSNYMGTTWQTQPDTPKACYRPQNDKLTPNDDIVKNALVGDRFFSAENWKNGMRPIYYSKILRAQPYTDEKGYEVITPFPWGRWQSLRTAYNDTRKGIIRLQGTNPTEYVNPEDETVLKGVDTFLFAGIGTGDGTANLSDNLKEALTTNNSNPLYSGARQHSSFVLDDDTPDPLMVPKTGVSSGITADLSQTDSVQQRLDMFLTGKTSSDTSFGMLSDLQQFSTEYGQLVNNEKSGNVINDIGLTPSLPSPDGTTQKSILDKIYSKLKR